MLHPQQDIRICAMKALEHPWLSDSQKQQELFPKTKDFKKVHELLSQPREFYIGKIVKLIANITGHKDAPVIRKKMVENVVDEYKVSTGTLIATLATLLRLKKGQGWDTAVILLKPCGVGRVGILWVSISILYEYPHVTSREGSKLVCFLKQPKPSFAKCNISVPKIIKQFYLNLSSTHTATRTLRVFFYRCESVLSVFYQLLRHV